MTNAVPDDELVYTNRARAESFGTVADQYDRYRPSYPDALISDLTDLGPARALDVACGTGKVAVPLLACGIGVLGVELDEKMAAVARRHGIFVEVGAFETWDDRGRTFDLITCGQGWHWIDPEQGPQKAARLLNPGGTLALFWNYDDLDEHLRAAINEAYRTHAPEIAKSSKQHGQRDLDDSPYLAGLRATGKFVDVHVKHYHWDRSYTAQEWIGRAATHSDHIALPSQQRAALLDALGAVIDKHGGQVAAHFGTYTIFARAPE